MIKVSTLITFELWKRSVDLAVSKLCGMSADDLPDAPYYDWYERGLAGSRG